MKIRRILEKKTVCLILCFMGECGKTVADIQQSADVKYMDESILSKTTREDEKAFQKMNEHIRDVIRQENGKGLYNYPDDGGTRKYFYNKYRKIGKSKKKNSDYDKILADIISIKRNDIFNNIKAKKLKSDYIENNQQYQNTKELEIQQNKKRSLSKNQSKINHTNNMEETIYLKNKLKDNNKIGIDDKPNSIRQEKIDQRRIRRCEIKMEDLRESYIPFEQLSIYHPKMSMAEQFIMSDTMF